MAKIKRSSVATFLNTNTIISPTWSLIGPGVTSGVINYNPKLTEETYIHEDNATISVDSYAPKMPLEVTAIVGDAVFNYMEVLRKTRAVLSDVESEVLNVWLYKTPSLTYYLAERQSVSLSIDSFGGDGGESVKFNFTINYIGDPVIGGYAPGGTFYPLAINTILTTLVIGTPSKPLTPLFATNKAWLWYSLAVATGVSVVSMASTLVDATIVQKVGVDTVVQGADAALSVGVNHLTVKVTVGLEEVTYKIDVTRAAA